MMGSPRFPMPLEAKALVTDATDRPLHRTVIGMMEQGGERMNSVMRKRPTIHDVARLADVSIKTVLASSMLSQRSTRHS